MSKNVILYSLQETRKLLPKEYKKKAILVYFLIFINSIFDLVGLAAILPLFGMVLQPNFIEKYNALKWVYEAFNFSSTNQFIVVFAILIFFGIVLKNGIGLLINREQAKFSFSIYEYLTERMLNAKLAKGYLYFASENSNKLVNDVCSVPRLFSGLLVFPLLVFINEGLILCLTLIILISFDWLSISLLITIISPLIILFYYHLRIKLNELGENFNSLMQSQFKPIFELNFGYTDAVMTGTKNHFAKKYLETVNEVVKNQIMQNLLNLAPSRVIEITMVLAVILILLYEVIIIHNINHAITIISVLGLAAYRSIPSINRMLVAVMQIKSQQYAFPILQESLNPIKPSPKSNQSLIFKHSIQFQNINFTYPGGSKKILSDFSLTIYKGRSIGLMGSSGSGKTTLIHILLGFLEPQSGQLLIDNTPITPEIVEAWQHKIGYVRQDVFLVDGTLEENIAFGVAPANINHNKIQEVVQKAALQNLVAELPQGVQTKIGERGSQLSGGQRQRVGIARALYHGAEVLVFDEATSALDSQTELEINESLYLLSKDGFTLITIAHRESTLKYCDEVITI